jgi:hypothetical protein
MMSMLRGRLLPGLALQQPWKLKSGSLFKSNNLSF